ncbi:MAG: hypothetical protein HY673_02160, partial [Chloroflexi bacterium]|nr:hypothetical protein [Chloroflexota bacterium]
MKAQKFIGVALAAIILLAGGLPGFAPAMASPAEQRPVAPAGVEQAQPGVWDLVFYALTNSVTAAGGEDIVIDLKLVNSGKREGYIDITAPSMPPG